MNSNRYGRHFLFPLILIVASVFLFLGGPDYSSRRSVKALWDLGHVAYFALLTAQLIRWKFLHRCRLPARWISYLVLALMLGTFVELLQYGSARTPDIEDISRDLMGTLLVLAFTPGLLVLAKRRSESYTRCAVLVLFFIHLIPLTQSTLDELHAHLSFPVIADFKTPFEMQRWHGNTVRTVVRMDPNSPRYQMKIRFSTDRYSSASMQYPVQDWSEYAYLYVLIFQPSGETLRVTIRIHDEAHELGVRPYQYHDRFNRTYGLDYGWNTIKIPLQDIRVAASGRFIDLTRIRNLNLFTSALVEPQEIFLQAIYLSSQ